MKPVRATAAALLLASKLFSPSLADASDAAGAPSYHAGDTPHLTLAIPAFESRISLGVYSSDGKLVRKLAEMVPESDFEVGLNGLIVRWDGNGDDGEIAPPGIYAVKGFATGKMRSEKTGVAGNDWREEFGEELPVTGILGMAPGPEGALVLLASLDGGEEAVFCYDPSGGELRWSRKLGRAREEPWVLARPATEWLALLRGGAVELLDPKNGAIIARGSLPGEGTRPLSVEVRGGELLVAGGGGVVRYDLLGFREIGDLAVFPRGTARFAEERGRLFAVDSAGLAWVRGEKGWTVFLPDSDARFGDISHGDGGRFWALVRQGQGGTYIAGQFDFDGDFIRQIEPSAFSGQPEEIVASRDGETLFVRSRMPGHGEEIAGIRKVGEPGRPVWETFFRKKIAPSEGALPEGYRSLPIRVQIEVASAMGRGRESTVFRLALLPYGTVRLSAPDGLAVADLLVLPRIFAASASVDPRKPDSLTLRVEVPGAAETYRVAGISKIARLDAGEIGWKVGEAEGR